MPFVANLSRLSPSDYRPIGAALAALRAVLSDRPAAKITDAYLKRFGKALGDLGAAFEAALMRTTIIRAAWEDVTDAQCIARALTQREFDRNLLGVDTMRTWLRQATVDGHSAAEMPAFGKVADALDEFCVAIYCRLAPPEIDLVKDEVGEWAYKAFRTTARKDIIKGYKEARKSHPSWPDVNDYQGLWKRYALQYAADHDLPEPRRQRGRPRKIEL